MPYWVETKAGRKMGPYAAGELREALRQGQLSLTDRARVGRYFGAWQSLDRIDELFQVQLPQLLGIGVRVDRALSLDAKDFEKIRQLKKEYERRQGGERGKAAGGAAAAAGGDYFLVLDQGGKSLGGFSRQDLEQKYKAGQLAGAVGVRKKDSSEIMPLAVFMGGGGGAPRAGAHRIGEQIDRPEASFLGFLKALLRLLALVFAILTLAYVYREQWIPLVQSLLGD